MGVINHTELEKQKMKTKKNKSQTATIREAKRREGMQENRDRKLALESIAKGDWFMYMSEAKNLVVMIQRSMIPLIQERIPNNDCWNACSLIADFVKPHVKILTDAGYRFGQSEGFLKQPIVATWHVLMLDSRVYVADREFIPYPTTAFIPSQR